MRTMIALGLALLIGGVATAQTPPAKADAPVKPPKEKKICHSVRTTGSMMPTSICHTRAEWDAINQAGARGVSQMLDTPNVSTPRQ